MTKSIGIYLQSGIHHYVARRFRDIVNLSKPPSGSGFTQCGRYLSLARSQSGDVVDIFRPESESPKIVDSAAMSKISLDCANSIH